MPRTRALIATTSIVGVTLLGVGVASAQGGEVTHRDPASSPTTVPDDFTAIFDILEPDQLICLMGNVESLEDPEDLGGMFNLLTECGVSIDQILEIGESTGGQPVVGTEPVKPNGDDDVLAALGLEPADLECIDSGLSGTVPVADDAAAFALLQECDVSLLDLLRGVVTLDRGVIDDDEIAPGTAPTTSADTSVESPGGIVDMFIEQMADQGINLDGDQAQCLLDNISSLDLEDLSASLEVFEECGISISDLLGS